MSYSWFITRWWGGRKKKGRTSARGEKCVAVSGREGSLENKRHINLFLSPFWACSLTVNEENMSVCLVNSALDQVGDAGCDFFYSAWPLCWKHDLCYYTHTPRWYITHITGFFLMLPHLYYTFSFISYRLSILFLKSHLIYCDSKNLFTWVSAVMVL